MKTHLLVASALLLSTAWLGCGDSKPPAGPPRGAALAAPANIAATRGAQKVTLTWDAVTGASSYNLYWSNSAGVTKATGTKVAGIAATTYAHAQLSPGTFHYVVTATGAGGEESADSTEASADVHLAAFASSTVSDANGGNLGAWPGAGGKTGTAAGDAICQSLASAASLVGTFTAWLSDGTDDAYCRIHGLTGKKAASCGQAALPVSAGPWVRMDGTPWAGAIASITDASGVEDVRVPLLYDEHGAVNSSVHLFATGTSHHGSMEYQHCNGWTSSAAAASVLCGTTTAVGLGWTEWGGTSCHSPSLRLLCLQTGTGPALPASAPTGARKAFMTSTVGSGQLSSWSGAGSATGAAAGDAVCRSLAAAAGLANAASFKAWLGLKDPGLTTGSEPVDRLTSDGPWERVDGVRVADDRAHLGDGSILTGLEVDESGHHVDALVSQWVWTGDHYQGTGTSLQATCANWTSSMPGDSGIVGECIEAGDHWSRFLTLGCNQTRHLYCFED